jgi:beta-glucosidase
MRFRWIAVVLLAIAAPLPLRAQEPPPYLDNRQPVAKRIDDLLARMTLEEKVGMCHANTIFTIAGVPRLGIPDLTMADGPMGVREEVGAGFRVLNRDDDFATAMPAPIALAATWDVAMARLCGETIGSEALARGKHVMLNPAINIMRSPLGGRGFEYFGEDPYLTGQLAVNFIQGEQSQGVAACVKHFAVNNQETQRGTVNVELDERTLREIYLPAFEASVQQGGALAVMGAYNKVRGFYCCENSELLNIILKTQWGFQGVVISDWGAVHSTDLAATSGLDIEMGTSGPYDRYFLANPFLEGLKSGKYPVSAVDEKVRRILYVMFTLNLIGENNAKRTGALNTPDHHEAARRIAEKAIVLLKNEQNLLPLAVGKDKTIAVIGDNAVAKHTHAGYGATVKASYEITPLEGITRLVGDRAKISFAQGYPAPGARGGRRGAAPPTTAPEQLAAEAVALAKQSDLVIYVGGLNHTRNYDDEGSDRRDLKLTPGQDALLKQLLAVNPKTVVVLNGGGPIDMTAWLDKAPAVLMSWYGGMEAGNALARVLFGEVSPSGKLPCTFPKALSDSPAHALNAFPGSNGVVKYDEGILVGYRWFDTKQIEPLFAFGHGLSYTTFAYRNLKLVTGTDPSGPVLTAQFDLTNTGQRDGAEVAQVYVQDPQSSLPRPEKELRGFRKISLKPGETQTVSIPLNADAFSYYDPQKSAWVAEAGVFDVHIGGSSRDLKLQASFDLPKTRVTP